MNKKWYWSKVLWVNAIAIVAIILGKDVIDPNLQVGVLAGINFILRLITKESVEW